MKLKYNSSAEVWTEALPVGNGRLGAMIFGGAVQERLQLNEDTLWSGSPKETSNPKAKEVLPKVRQAIKEERYTDADQLTKEMMGPYTQTYLPLGNLYLTFDHGNNVSAYERTLDLQEGIAKTIYNVDGVTYKREIFASHPDQVIIIRLEANKPNSLTFTARLESDLKFKLNKSENKIVLSGICPENVNPNYYKTEEPISYGESATAKAMTFTGQLVTNIEDGTSFINDEGLQVKNASKATLVFSAATSFNGFDKVPDSKVRNPHVVVGKYIKHTLEKPYSQLKQTHIEDYQSLFNRLAFQLNATDEFNEYETDKRVAEYGEKDLKLIELMFHYGRYLLIASSRPGTQPANLQGIWNDKLQPPWSSNYTLNINMEMNYWLAEVCNLSECHQPLLEFVKDLSITGGGIASENYGCRGWTAHHNADIWRQAAPVGAYGHGDPVWAFWPMAGPWLSQHLWEHYLFTQDGSFLEHTAYPVMKSAALFCLDWLVENDSGYLITFPSTSPEHKFTYDKEKLAAVSTATTMDMALIWDLFSNTIAASRQLNVDEDLREELVGKRERLYPYKIGKYGQLQEWSEDWEDEDVNHRHVSHLFGVYPGRQLTNLSSPDLYQAAKVSLNRRGDEGTGWSLAWKLCLWARFRDSERAHRLISNLFNVVTKDSEKEHKGGVYPNLFGAHPPFQIDGNFGFTAGIVEMLIQSHAGFIEFLPALPENWSEGKIEGLRVRGGFEAAIYWRNKKLENASIHSLKGQPCTVLTNNRLTVMSNGKPVDLEHLGKGMVRFPTEVGQVYTVKQG